MTHGMAFERKKTMVKKFTYKELTLVLGILVALIIVFTLWIYKPTSMHANFRAKRPSIVEIFRDSAIKTYAAAADELR
jgi:predicted ABC-type sugar transport system permease subunit